MLDKAAAGVMSFGHPNRSADAKNGLCKPYTHLSEGFRF